MKSFLSIGAGGKDLADAWTSRQPGSTDPVGHADRLLAQLGQSTSLLLVQLYATSWPADTYWQRVLTRLQQQQRLKAAETLPGARRDPDVLRPAGRAPRPLPPSRRQGAAPIPRTPTASHPSRKRDG